jgi:hypothetical protein
VKLLEERKFWAKNDMMKIGDTHLLPNPVDPFKQCHVVQPLNKDIPDKALTKAFLQTNKKTKCIKKTKYRWTELKLVHENGGKRIFDTIKPAHLEVQDLAPLYSSFAADNIFKPPISSKEVLIKEHREIKKEERKPERVQIQKEMVDTSSPSKLATDPSQYPMGRTLSTDP